MPIEFVVQLIHHNEYPQKLVLPEVFYEDAYTRNRHLYLTGIRRNKKKGFSNWKKKRRSCWDKRCKMGWVCCGKHRWKFKRIALYRGRRRLVLRNRLWQGWDRKWRIWRWKSTVFSISVTYDTLHINISGNNKILIAIY